MKFLNFNRVLCLSTHPDDAELAISGLVMKHTSTIFDIYCVSYGTSTDGTAGPNRVTEVLSFWESLNLKNVNLIFPKGVFTLGGRNEDEWIFSIENDIMSKNKYDAILGPAPDDAHFEHRLVSGFMTALSRKSNIATIEYKSVSTLEGWTPNLFIDINSFFILKKTALQTAFKSQMKGLYFQDDCINLFHNHYPCMKRGVKNVEQLKVKMLYS